MKQSKSGEENFKNWICQQDFRSVYDEVGSNNKAIACQNLMSSAMSDFYPIITTKRKSTEDPWINNRIKKKIKQRKGVFRREGGSVKWKKSKNISDKMVKFRHERYMEEHKLIIMEPGSSTRFFKNVRSYGTVECAP